MHKLEDNGISTRCCFMRIACDAFNLSSTWLIMKSKLFYCVTFIHNSIALQNYRLLLKSWAREKTKIPKVWSTTNVQPSMSTEKFSAVDKISNRR